MSVGQFYGLCQQYRGRAVEIRTRNGRIHRGIIRHVDNRSVYLQHLGRNRNFGGFGYGAFGGGYGGPGGFAGYGSGGFGIGIALGAIGTLALLPFVGFI